jgi:hypothetical protein
LALGISALRPALRTGLRSEDSSEKREACGTPHHSEFSFHFVVPFVQMGCDHSWANADNAMTISGSERANYRSPNSLAM